VVENGCGVFSAEIIFSGTEPSKEAESVEGKATVELLEIAVSTVLRGPEFDWPPELIVTTSNVVEVTAS